MNQLNYHHLLYFWMTVREGTIAQASEKLHLSQPTISTQLRLLERQLGSKLFAKAGRKLRLTDTGQTVYRYAEEIFNLGRELEDTLKGMPTGRPMRLSVGAVDVLPKLFIYRMLRPAFQLPQSVRLLVRDGSHEDLLQRLVTHELDLVLSDVPATGNTGIRLFSHLLGSSGVSFFGTPELVAKHQATFPESLGEAPLLLPPSGTTLRRALDQWFDDQAIRPRIQAEFADSALMKVFGREGFGLFPTSEILREEVEAQYDVRCIGTIEDIQDRYYAISAERRLKHPAVLAVTEAAKDRLFD